MKEKEEKMHFPKIDDFFTTQEERDEQKLEKVEKIAVSSISNFPNHPYQVKENEEMEDFVENVKEKGVIHPVIVRPKKDGTYEMSSKADGYIVFENLRYGTYYIKETKSTSGYELSDKIVKLEINDNGVFVDETLIEEKDSVYCFEFENTEIEVPNTGDSRYTKIFIFIGGISVISLIGIVAYDYKKRKNKV